MSNENSKTKQPLNPDDLNRYVVNARSSYKSYKENASIAAANAYMLWRDSEVGTKEGRDWFEKLVTERNDVIKKNNEEVKKEKKYVEDYKNGKLSQDELVNQSGKTKEEKEAIAAEKKRLDELVKKDDAYWASLRQVLIEAREGTSIFTRLVKYVFEFDKPTHAAMVSRLCLALEWIHGKFKGEVIGSIEEIVSLIEANGGFEIIVEDQRSIRNNDDELSKDREIIAAKNYDDTKAALKGAKSLGAVPLEARYDQEGLVIMIARYAGGNAEVVAESAHAQSAFSSNYYQISLPYQQVGYVVSWQGAYTSAKSAFQNSYWWGSSNKAMNLAGEVASFFGTQWISGIPSNLGPAFAYNNSYLDDGVVFWAWAQNTSIGPVIQTVEDPTQSITYALQTPSILNIGGAGEPWGSTFPSNWLGGPLSPFFVGGTLQVVGTSSQPVNLTQNFTVANTSGNTVDLNGNNANFGSFYQDQKGPSDISFINSGGPNSGGQVTINGISYISGQTTIGQNVNFNIQNFPSSSSASFANNGSLTFLGGVNTKISGNITGNGSLTINGAGITLAGNNTYTGTTTIYGSAPSNSATLTVGSSTGLSASSPIVLQNYGVLALGGYSVSVSSLNLAGGSVTGGSLSGQITSTGGAISSNIIGGSSLAINSGTTTLSGNNTYTGTTTVNGGTLTAGAANVFSANSSTTVNIGGMLNFGGDAQTINAVSLAGGTLTNGSLTGAITSTGGVMNNISGAASLTNTSGTTTLTGTNTYTGATTINAGTLLVGNANALSPNSGLAINSGGALNLNNINTSIGSFSGAGAVNLGSAILTVGGNNSNTTYSGAMTGTGGLTVNGTGTMTVSALQYSGATTINGGTLNAGITNAFSANSVTTVNTGGTLNLGGYNQSINSLTLNGGLITNGSLTNVTTSNGGGISNISGSSSFLITTGSPTQASTTTLLGSNTYTGATTINSNATLTAGAANAFSATSATTINNNAYLNLGGYNQSINNVSLTGGAMLENGNLSGAITVSGSSNRIAQLGGSASLTVNTGAGVTLSQPNTYTGNTVINGSLEGYGPDVLSAASLTFINSTGSLYLDGWQQTINNVNLLGGTIYGGSFIGAINSDGGTINGIGGSGTLVAAAGTTTMQGNNTFSSIILDGGTINNQGTLNGPVTTNGGSSSSPASIAPSRNRVMAAAAQTVSINPANSARAQSSMVAPNVGVFNNSGWVTGSLLNNGQLNIIGDKSRISGPITGSGEINVNGAFRQESSISNGVINVNNGGALLTTAGLNAQSLNIKGGGTVVAASDITAPINVANGGTLTSSGLRNINGDVRNAGDVFLLTPGDKLNVNGAYSQAASGRFTTVIGSTEKYGKVESAQNLNIENGSTINAVIDRRLRPTSGTVYSAVLKGADAPFQSQINVLTNTPRYNMSAVWNGNQVDLHVSSPYLGALADQTLSSISAVQGPTLNALHQRYAVLNAVMEYDCNKFDKLNFCISAQARTTGFGTQTTGAGVFNIAYRPTNETRIGAYLDYQVAAGNPSTYGPSTAGTLNTGSVNYGYDNATFGGYLGYSQSGYSGRIVNTGVQAIVSGGYNPGKMVTTRALTLDPYGFDFIDSQPGSGTASLNAYYARGLLGYGFALTDKATLMPYLGVRYTDVSRGGYMEGFNAAVTQPLVFNAYYERLVTGFGGMMLNGQMTDQFGVTAGLGV